MRGCVRHRAKCREPAAAPLVRPMGNPPEPAPGRGVSSLPATPGAKCPATEEERAFREKHKPEFDAIKAEKDAVDEELRGKRDS